MSYFTSDWLHKWQTSATNRWGETVEQRRALGEYRHRTFDDNLKPLDWVNGPSPIAQRLRDQGKTQTEGFAP